MTILFSQLAAAEEATLVEEFTSRLAYNLGKVGGAAGVWLRHVGKQAVAHE